MADNVQLVFDFLVGKNDVDKTLKGVQGETAKTEKSFFNLGNAIKFSAITAGFFAVKSIVTKLTDAAVAQEKAIKSLNISMALTGEYSAQASKEMKDFADTMSDLSLVEDDLIITQLSVAKAFGQTNEQAKQTVKVALDLSAAMGTSLDSAVQLLSKSYSGQLGQLSKLIPETNNLSKEALRSGEAVAIAGEKFKDFAKNQVGDFDGATTRLSKSFDDMLKNIGLLITQSPLVIDSINFITDAMKAAEVTTIGVAENFKGWAGIIQDKFFNALDKINPKVIEAETKLKLLGFTFDGVTREVEDAVPPITEFQKKLEEMSAKAETPAEKLKRQIKEIGDALRSSFSKEDLDSIAGPNSTYVQNLIKSGATLEEIQTKLKETINAQKELDKNLKESADEAAKKAEEVKQKQMGQIGQAISGVSAGAAGAGSVIGLGAGMAADAFIPGSSQIVGPLVQLLGQSSDQLRETIRGFVDGAAEFILNIVENIPVLITELINGIPRFINAILKGIPRVINGIIEEIPRMIEAFVLQIPNIIRAFIDNIPAIAQAFTTELVLGAPLIINGLIAEFPRMIPELMKGIGEGIINAIKDAFKSLLPGGGGGGLIGGIVGGAGDLVSGIGDAFGFSNGGVVPGSGNRDTVPAMLTPGERVLTVEQNNIFEQMLAQMKKNGGASSSQPIQINLQVGTRELASVLLDINRSNLRVA